MIGLVPMLAIAAGAIPPARAATLAVDSEVQNATSASRRATDLHLEQEGAP